MIDPQLFAQRLQSARLELRTIEPASKESALDETWAYEVQQADLQTRQAAGERLVGMKLGLTSWAKQEQMNVDRPVIGFLTDAMLASDELVKARYHQPRIEPELVLRTSRAISNSLTLEEVPEFVDGVAAGFEIIDSRYPRFSFTYEDVIADNTSAAGFGYGEFSPLFPDISDRAAFIREDGANERFGTLRDILGNPLQALVFLSRHLESTGASLPAGSIVLAGSMTDALILHPGSEYRVEIDGLQPLEVRVVDPNS